jgi:hypothetical protein
MKNRLGALSRESQAGVPQVAAPAKPSPAPQAVARPSSPPVEPPPSLDALTNKYSAEVKQNSCRAADDTYRQILEHFPEHRFTARQRLDHARCQRVLGRYGAARGELDQLQNDAQLRPSVTQELKLLDEEQAPKQRAYKMPAEPAPAAGKKKAKPAAVDSAAQPAFSK